MLYVYFIFNYSVIHSWLPAAWLLPLFIEITFFVCTNKTNPQNLKESLNRIVIIAKEFLKLPNKHNT